MDTSDHRTASFIHADHELVYYEYGSGDDLIVYTHGLLMDSDMNRGIAQALAEQGNRVVLLDFLGHGRSDKPTHASDYRIDSYSDQIIALLDELGVERAVFGGVSLGANAGLFAASRHAERARGLVLEMPVLERAVPSAAMVFAPMLALVHFGTPVLRWIGSQLRRLPETPFDPLNSVLHGLTLPPETVAAVLHGILVGPVAPTKEARASLGTPTLVLAHAHDFIHPFDDAQNLARRLPNASLVRARSPLELRMRPDRLTAEIAAFVENVWAGEPDAGRAVASSSGR
jgi:pimeloyl-ACP methyl ester carboxylesterase